MCARECICSTIISIMVCNAVYTIPALCLILSLLGGYVILLGFLLAWHLAIILGRDFSNHSFKNDLKLKISFILNL